MAAPFYIVAEYPMAASLLMSFIIYFSFALGLSAFSSENRTLDNTKSPGIYFSYFYFKKTKESFLLREGIVGKAIVTDKKNSTSAGRSVEHTDYELYFSFVTSEKTISKSQGVISEKEFQSVNVGDSLAIIYLPKKRNVFDLIISKNDKAFYAKNLKLNR